MPSHTEAERRKRGKKKRTKSRQVTADDLPGDGALKRTGRRVEDRKKKIRDLEKELGFR